MEPRSVGTGCITRWGGGVEGHILNYTNHDSMKDMAIKHLMKDMQQLLNRAVHDETKEKGWP